MLLRAVRCKNKKDEYEDKVNDIRSCLMQAVPSGQSPTQELQIQPTEDLYRNHLNESGDVPFYWNNKRRLVRPDIADVSAYPGRTRWTLNATLRQGELERRKTNRNLTVTFELYVQNG